jgi:hypothetical protein
VFFSTPVEFILQQALILHCRLCIGRSVGDLPTTNYNS